MREGALDHLSNTPSAMHKHDYFLSRTWKIGVISLYFAFWN